jgi:hypothetical protein
MYTTVHTVTLYTCSKLTLQCLHAYDVNTVAESHMNMHMQWYVHALIQLAYCNTLY